MNVGRLACDRAARAAAPEVVDVGEQDRLACAGRAATRSAARPALRACRRRPAGRRTRRSARTSAACARACRVVTISSCARVCAHSRAPVRNVGDDAGDLAAVVERASRDRAHQAERAAAIDQADAVLGKGRAEALWPPSTKFGIGTGTGAAIDADSFDRVHMVAMVALHATGSSRRTSCGARG